MATPQSQGATTTTDAEAWASLLQQGKNLYGEGRMQEAATIFNHLISANVYVGEALYGRGLICLAGGDLDGATEELVLALQYRPLDAHAFYVLGTIYERRSALDVARMYYSQALALDPGLAGARARLEHLAAVHTPGTKGAAQGQPAGRLKRGRVAAYAITSVVLALGCAYLVAARILGILAVIALVAAVVVIAWVSLGTGRLRWGGVVAYAIAAALLVGVGIYVFIPPMVSGIVFAMVVVAVAWIHLGRDVLRGTAPRPS